MLSGLQRILIITSSELSSESFKSENCKILENYKNEIKLTVIVHIFNRIISRYLLHFSKMTYIISIDHSVLIENKYKGEDLLGFFNVEYNS